MHRLVFSLIPLLCNTRVVDRMNESGHSIKPQDNFLFLRNISYLSFFFFFFLSTVVQKFENPLKSYVKSYISGFQCPVCLGWLQSNDFFKNFFSVNLSVQLCLISLLDFRSSITAKKKKKIMSIVNSRSFWLNWMCS